MSDDQAAAFADALFDVPRPPSTTAVHDAYAKAVEQLRSQGVLTAIHEGLAANLLRLGTIIDNERKGYAVAHATGQAHDIMKTLLGLAPEQTADEFVDIMKRLEESLPKSGPPTL